jgi:hypothetical protein
VIVRSVWFFEAPAMAVPEYIVDAKHLSASKLSAKYPLTYSTWRNMKARAKKQNAPIADEFMKFDSFLTVMGPRPSTEHTLDRRDPNNPFYGPKHCRWLDKKGQANNRTTTLYLTIGDEKKPLTRWAEETNQRPDTLRYRLHAGWSDFEVVHGKGSDPKNTGATSYAWLPNDIAAGWEQRYNDYRKTANQPHLSRLHFMIKWAGEDLGVTDVEISQLSYFVQENERTSGNSAELNLFLSDRNWTYEKLGCGDNSFILSIA